MITFRFAYSKIDVQVPEAYARWYSKDKNVPALRRTVVIAPHFVSIHTELRECDETIYYWTKGTHPAQIEYDFTAKCGCTLCEATRNFYAQGTGNKDGSP